MPDSETDESELAQRVVDELDPGSIVEDKVILSRRQVVGLATGTLSVGALAGFGEAQAQSAAGQVGTSSEPVDVEAAQVNAQTLEAGNIKSGSASVSDIPASTDTSLDSSQTKTASVTFNQTFESAPHVVSDIDGSQTQNAQFCFSNVRDVTTTGFDITFRNYGTDPVFDAVAEWIAIA